jgi:hypothetical protein
VAGQPIQAAEPVDQLEVEAAESRQHRVQPGDVVALRREVPVPLAENLQMEPADDVERAERGSRMAGAGALDHVERVQAAGVRKGGCPVDRVAVEGRNPPTLLEGNEPEGGGTVHASTVSTSVSKGMVQR